MPFRRACLGVSKLYIVVHRSLLVVDEIDFEANIPPLGHEDSATTLKLGGKDIDAQNIRES